ncbi:hypothetical protein DL96DRAFT_1587977 [Flagelloscypha sp. PMI_526]|nr:hypothetical protein DL96DRAFT_1587977 [Flagelloscypha sp. PMI_526]
MRLADDDSASEASFQSAAAALDESPANKGSQANGIANGHANGSSLNDTPLENVILESGLARGVVPPVPENSNPYDPTRALEDLPCVVYAMDEFLANKMVESEEYLAIGNGGDRLYFTTGIGLIQTVKALLSYADEDLLAALGHTKHANAIASHHRKRAGNVVSRLSGYISGSSHGTKWYTGMTKVELHGELTYAESLFEKALLGIVYSGDWIAFIKEALNMRTCVGIYRGLYSFLQLRDSEHSGKTAAEHDPDIDPHLRSGVYLGAGLLNVILSMLPRRLLGLMEIFGYGGDRKLGLDILMSAGGWTKDNEEPGIGTDKEGVRRPLCDLGMLIFHLVLSTFTFECVDIDFAEKLVRWNIRRWPDGIFPLLASGRLALTRSQPVKAIQYYEKALNSQKQYRNLWHMCWWELAIAHLCLWQVEESLGRWKSLMGEATWSRTVYTYGYACCLLQLATTPGLSREELSKEKKLAMIKEAKELMEKVPNLRQKIAGKSIPLEKFVARRARKYLQQGHLVLPALELSCLFLGLARAPLDVMEKTLLPLVQAELAPFVKGEKRPKDVGYWDDYCLLKFLEGNCLRYLAYPDPSAAKSSYIPEISKDKSDKDAEACFKFVFENGKKIELDHQIVYMSHFEIGRIYACRGDTDMAKKEFDLVLSGKPLEVSSSGRKGKYSLENALHMKTTAAVDTLEKGSKSL